MARLPKNRDMPQTVTKDLSAQEKALTLARDNDPHLPSQWDGKRILFRSRGHNAGAVYGRLIVNASVPLLLMFTAWMFSPLPCAFGVTQEVVYKDSRPMKKLFEGSGQPGSSEAAEKTATPAKYIYDPTGKTDPFKSFIVEQEVVEEKKQRKPLTYLETLDLSQLELIAIIVGPKGNWAMVRDSKGIGHVIQKGTLIGTNSGIVYAVTDKEIVIREEYKDFKGTVQHKDIAKKLPSLE